MLLPFLIKAENLYGPVSENHLIQVFAKAIKTFVRLMMDTNASPDDPPYQMVHDNINAVEIYRSSFMP